MIYVYIEIFFSFIYLGTINKFLLLFQENILEKKINNFFLIGNGDFF